MRIRMTLPAPAEEVSTSQPGRGGRRPTHSVPDWAAATANQDLAYGEAGNHLRRAPWVFSTLRLGSRSGFGSHPAYAVTMPFMYRFSCIQASGTS